MKPHPILRKTSRALRRICDVVPPTWRGGILAEVSGLSLWFYGLNDLDLVPSEKKKSTRKAPSAKTAS